MKTPEYAAARARYKGASAREAALAHYGFKGAGLKRADIEKRVAGEVLVASPRPGAAKTASLYEKVAVSGKWIHDRVYPATIGSADPAVIERLERMRANLAARREGLYNRQEALLDPIFDAASQAGKTTIEGMRGSVIPELARAGHPEALEHMRLNEERQRLTDIRRELQHGVKHVQMNQKAPADLADIQGALADFRAAAAGGLSGDARAAEIAKLRAASHEASAARWRARMPEAVKELEARFSGRASASAPPVTVPAPVAPSPGPHAPAPPAAPHAPTPTHAPAPHAPAGGAAASSAASAASEIPWGHIGAGAAGAAALAALGYGAYRHFRSDDEAKTAGLIASVSPSLGAALDAFDAERQRQDILEAQRDALRYPAAHYTQPVMQQYAMGGGDLASAPAPAPGHHRRHHHHH